MSDKKIAQISAKSVTPEGEKWMRVIATAPTLDRDGEIIDTDSLRVPIKPKGWKYARDLKPSDTVDVPFLLDHKWEVEKQLGSVRSMFINADGELETLVGFTSLDRGREAHVLAKEGHLGNSFSGTFDYSGGFSVDGVIYDAEIIELSMVFKGSNRDARVLEVSKSTKKGADMANATADEIATKREELKAKLAELDAEEAPAVEDTEASEEAIVTAEAEAEAKVEQPVEKVVKPKAKKEAIKPKEEDTMTEDAVKSASAKAAATKPKEDVEQVQVEVKKNPNEYKVLAIKQIMAMVKKDYTALRELNEQAYKLDSRDETTKSLVKKEISYTDGNPLYLAEQLDRDVERCAQDVGNIGTLVTKKTLTESPKYSRIVRTDGVVFGIPGFSGTKNEDKPTWERFNLEPKPFAVIVAWNDHVAEDAYVNIYDEIVQDIAEGKARLEDELILTFAEVTAPDSTVYPDQGLSVLLDSSREVSYAYDETFVTSLAQAYGKLRSCDRNNFSMVMNGTTWGRIALLQDNQGRPLWNGTGQTISMGALGTVNVRTTDVLSEGQIIFGNYRRYYLAEKAGFQLKQSSEAVVGELNLFEDDASAVRAVLRAEGGPISTGAFVKLVGPETSA